MTKFMDWRVQKGMATLSIRYASSGFSNNLTAKDIHFDDDVGRLSLDLTENLRVRNKQTNCYGDAQELVSKHDRLTFLQIFGDGIIKAFERFGRKGAKLEIVELKLEKQAFQYEVMSGERSGNSVMLHLQHMKV
jgi:hypothetical protein